MAVGENHPPVKRKEWVRDGTTLRWECSDPECPGGDIYDLDLNDQQSDRYSWLTTQYLKGGRCPKDHRMLIL